MKLWRKWLRRLRRRLPGKEVPVHPDEDTGAHAEEEPPELHRHKRRLKEVYTHHWDLDYLPYDELERQYGGRRRKRKSG